jgi:hypothetical protein
VGGVDVETAKTFQAEIEAICKCSSMDITGMEWEFADSSVSLINNFKSLCKNERCLLDPQVIRVHYHTRVDHSLGKIKPKL